MPHNMSLNSGFCMVVNNPSKLSEDAKERSNIHSKIGSAKKITIPAIRWVMEAMAATGNLIVVKSRFTGRFLFTVAITYLDRKSTRLNSSHVSISYAVFCLKKKTKHDI